MDPFEGLNQLSLVPRMRRLLKNYSMWYSAYLVALITCGALAMLALERELGPINALYLAVSSVTMTGLSSIDFAAAQWTTHAVCWLLIILGSPVLLSIIPVALRLIIMMHSLRRDSADGAAPHQRRGGGAFFGLMTTAADECLALEAISVIVFGYWIGMQVLGWLALWTFLPLGSEKGDASRGGDTQHGGCGPWPALFLATSAFHNAGLISCEDGLPLRTAAAPWSLGTVMVLILCGNSCFPIALRGLVWFAARCPWLGDDRRRVLRLLLRFPRTCYTHLFPNYGTRWLAIVTPALVAIQIGALCVVDLWARPHHPTSKAIMTGLTLEQRLLAIVFHSVSTRTAGFSVLNLRLLSPTSAYVFCICMWISVCPVVVVMRSTTRAQGRIVSEYYYREDQGDQQRIDRRHVRHQLSQFMGQNTALLMTLLFLILVSEEMHTTERDVRERRFLFIVFEFCSAYGTVGLSMSAKPWSRSGTWSVPSQVLLMVVMFLGRLRGLPESIDPTFRFGTKPSRDGGAARLGGAPMDEHQDCDESSVPTSTEEDNLETMF